MDVSVEAQARRAAEQLTDASRAMVTVEVEADAELAEAPPVDAAGVSPVSQVETRRQRAG